MVLNTALSTDREEVIVIGLSDDELVVALNSVIDGSVIDGSVLDDAFAQPDCEARIRRLVELIAHAHLAVPAHLIAELEAWRGWRTIEDYLRFEYALSVVRLHNPPAAGMILRDEEALYWPLLDFLRSHGADTALAEYIAEAGEFDAALTDLCSCASRTDNLIIPSDLADLSVLWLAYTDQASQADGENMAAAILRRKEHHPSELE